jgi:hypothetical protein
MKPLEKTQLVVNPSIGTTIPNRSIVIFDTTVEGWEGLAAGVIPGTEVVVLHPQQDGVAQIGNFLTNRSNIAALHIISHGSPGCLYLGSVLLNTDNLESYSQTLGQWCNALSGKAEILLYGCEVAAGEIGESFVQRLSEITGADIAASDDRTGNAAKGGDWELEVRTGDINTPLAFAPETIAEYPGVLTREPEWIEQLGTTELDYSRGITVDSAGNLYITGYTRGNLGGTNAGDFDAWVAKYDSSGTQQWIQQFGTTGLDYSTGITVDSAGNLYITGETTGNLGGINAGNYGDSQDAWVAKYDSSGTQQWIQQLGTTVSDHSRGITVDSAGNLYITGETTGNLGGTNAGILQDAWVAKYDSSGTQQWIQQFGTTGSDVSNGITVDSAGNLYITGYTGGNLGGTNAGVWDAWVAKYDSSGTQQWIQQFGTTEMDVSSGITVDSAGNLYITGYTRGNLGGTNAGDFDAWVAKYDSSGTQQWIQQLGATGLDYSRGITVDSAGNLYITGSTQGNLGGTNAGSDDAWVAKYDSSGTQQWVQQLGTTSNEVSRGITVDSAGKLYITGETQGNLGGTNAGGWDAWIAKLSPVASIAPGTTPSETGPTTGTFILTLTEPAAVGGVTVNYTVAGTATSGIDYTALSGSVVIPAGSTTATIDVIPVDDTIVDPDETVEVTLSLGTGYVPHSLNSTATLTITDNDTAGITVSAISGNTSEAGGTASFEVVLDTEPTADVTVNLVSSNTAEGTVSVPSITFTPSNWNVPQTATVTGVDDTVADGNITYTIQTTVTSADTAYSSINPSDVSVINIDNDTPNILVTQSGGSTAVTEGGTTDTYQLVLTTAPTANVNITITPDAQTDLGNGAGTAVTRTFTAANWESAQTITVTAADDTAVEYAHTSTISHSVTSTDADYNSMTVGDITANVTDNDLPQVNIAAGNNASEANTSSGQFTLTLSDAAPTGGITVNYSVAGTATSGTDYIALSESVFIPAGATSANINIVPVDDFVDEDDESVEVSLNPGTNYNIGSSGTATTHIIDNDTAEIQIVESGSGTEVTEGGSADTYTVVLSSQPTADVRMDFSTDANLNPIQSLTFNASNWKIPQTVTVSAVEDDELQGDRTSAIVHTVSSSDAKYNGMTLPNINAYIRDQALAETKDLAEIKEGLASGFTLLENFLNEQLSQLALPIVDKSLQDILPSDFAEKLRTDVLGAINDALDDGAKDLAGTMQEKLSSVFSKVEIDPEISDEEIKFTITGENSIDLASIPLEGTLGFPAFGIKAEGSADSAFEYQLSLGFGYNKDDGFYFDTENTELSFDLGLGLSDNFKATGTAAFLQLDLENNADDPTKIGAEFKVALQDIDNLPESGDDGDRLTFSELQGNYNLTDLFATTLDTTANLGLKAVTSIEGSAAIPSFNFDLKAEFPVLKYEDGEWSGPQKPTLAFNEMQIDLGTFVTDFAKPIITTVNDVVDPARPVIDTLTKDVSPLSQIEGLKKIFDQNNDGKVTLIEAGATIARKKVDTRFLDALGTIAQVSDALKELSDQEGTLKIDLGSYEVKFDATDPNADLTKAETTTTEEATSPEEQAKSKAGNSKITQFLEALNRIEGLSFPLLSKPLTAIDLLLGKDVTLFAYQMPKLDIDFGFQREFPLHSVLGVGINGELGGNFNAKSNLGFGFDTYGLSQWKNTDFALADSYKIFDGFYVSDRQNADGTGPDVNELKLTADISVGANLSIAVAKASLKGGVQGTANLDLLDIGEENGTSDGKVRGSEIISRISNPLSMFEINGKVDAFLDGGVYGRIPFSNWKPVWEKRLATYNLAEFRLGSGPTRRSRAIDGYISAGTVFFDANFNGVWDAEVEPFAITNPDGSFDLMVELEKFDTNQNGEIDVTEGKIVMGDGIDVSTYLPLVTPLTSTFDATVVTPLTTLIAQLVEQGIDLAQAQANVKAALGLPAGIDLQHYDPLEAMANGDANGLTVFAAMIQVQNTIVQTAKLMQGVSEIPLMQLGYAAIKAIANRLNSGTPVDLTQTSEIEAIVNSAIAFAAEAEPTLNSSQLATVASAAAEVIGLGNQLVEEITSSGQSLTDAATDIARLQSVAVGEIATSLPELAAGTVSVEQFLAQNTREAILEKMGNAFAKDPTVRPIFPYSIDNPIDFTDGVNLIDSPGGPILPQELAASSEGVNSGDNNALAQNPLDFNMNLFLRFFDAEYYLAQNTDVAAAVENGTFGSAAEHFGAFGFAEGRAPSELFTSEYLSQYTDVAEAVTNGTFRSGFEHFIKFGFAEGRFPSDVFKDLEMFYLWKNPDAAAAVGQGSYANGLEHLVAVELASGGNILSTYEVLAQTFDSQYYLMQNADVAQAVESGIFRSAMEHFIGFGMVEGRTPSMAYSDSYYLANHADVDEAVKNGIFRSGYEHYMMYGMAEGRIGGEMMGSANSDIILGTAGSNTLIGMEGDDILFGDAGHDILIGVNVNAANPGVGEVDRLIGDLGSDTFVLGDANRTYYDSGVDAETGLNDYAAIADFAIAEDKIQLHGSAADYRLAASPEEMFPGMAIYRQEGDREDLIAIVQDVSDLNLQESYFSFV